MMFFAIVALCLLLALVGGVYVFKKIWYKLHDIVGISPHTVRYQNSHLIAHHPNQELPVQLQGQDFLAMGELSEPFQTLNVRQNQFKQSTAHQSQSSLAKYWHTKHGKVTPLTYLPSLSAEKIFEVPSLNPVADAKAKADSDALQAKLAAEAKAKAAADPGAHGQCRPAIR